MVKRAAAEAMPKMIDYSSSDDTLSTFLPLLTSMSEDSQVRCQPLYGSVAILLRYCCSLITIVCFLHLYSRRAEMLIETLLIFSIYITHSRTYCLITHRFFAPSSSCCILFSADFSSWVYVVNVVNLPSFWDGVNLSLSFSHLISFSAISSSESLRTLFVSSPSRTVWFLATKGRRTML